MFLCVVMFHGLTEGDRGGRAGEMKSAACIVRRLSRLAICLGRRPQQDIHGVLRRRLSVPGSCMARDGRWVKSACVRRQRCSNSGMV